ncbi:hypothetical protein [Nonomuraea sp. NPDC049309]|uniref:hypothetical protein n=1 Tax=Nonomuraea sp. NPDC049309 TaxID=3364350 RepID=UPI0037237236
MNRSWCGWFGVGLAVTGAVTTIAAYATWGFAWPFLPASHPPEPPFGFWGIALVVLLMWVLIALVLDIRHSRDPQDGELRLYESRPPSMILAIGLAVAAVFRWIALTNTFKLGEPGGSEAALAIGLSATAVGLATAALTFRPRKKEWTGALGGAAVTVLATVAVVIAAAVVPVDATTTTKDTPKGAVPASVSRIAWQWQTPDGFAARHVAVAGGGLVAMIRDGVVALDSATGRERWHYRRPGGFAWGFKASPDGSTLLIRFNRRTVVLDAYTGAVLAEHPLKWPSDYGMWLSSNIHQSGPAFLEISWPGDYGMWLNSTNVVTAGLGHPLAHLWPGTLTGWRVTASEPAWHYTPPRGCLTGQDHKSSQSYHHAMALNVFAHVLICAPGIEQRERDSDYRYTPSSLTIVLLGLDPATGAEKWRHERKVTAAPESVKLHMSDDAKALSLIWGEDEGVVLDQASGKVIAQQRVTGAFNTDGVLDMGDHELKDTRWTSEWQPFGTGPVKRASFSLAGLNRSLGSDRATGQLPLDDSLVVTYPSDDPGPTASIVVLVTPWNTADTTRISIARTDKDIYHSPLRLLQAPGSLVFAHPEMPVVVGLV